MSNDLKPTIQDAIYCLKASRGEERCSKCRFYGSLYEAECQEVDEITLEALEKQIAKKPRKIEVEGYRYTDTYRCPICEGNFSGTGIAYYCYRCGQKLDWSEVE